MQPLSAEISCALIAVTTDGRRRDGSPRHACGERQGYYGNDAATAAAFRAGAGWFDTGDLGWIAPDGVAGSRMAGTVVLTGRSKDTIVLSRCALCILAALAAFGAARRHLLP